MADFWFKIYVFNHAEAETIILKGNTCCIGVLAFLRKIICVVYLVREGMSSIRNETSHDNAAE